MGRVFREHFDKGEWPLGCGVHGAIPLHLIFETHDLEVTAEKPLKFKVTLPVS